MTKGKHIKRIYQREDSRRNLTSKHITTTHIQSTMAPVPSVAVSIAALGAAMEAAGEKVPKWVNIAGLVIAGIVGFIILLFLLAWCFESCSDCRKAKKSRKEAKARAARHATADVALQNREQRWRGLERTR